MIIAIILVVIVRHPFDARILHFTTEIGKLMLKSISGENNRGKDSPPYTLKHCRFVYDLTNGLIVPLFV